MTTATLANIANIATRELRFGVELETQTYDGLPYAAEDGDCDQPVQEMYCSNQIVDEREERQRRAVRLLPCYRATVQYWHNVFTSRHVDVDETEYTEEDFSAAGVEFPHYLPWFLTNGAGQCLVEDFAEWLDNDEAEQLDVVDSLLEDYAYELKRDYANFFQDGGLSLYFAENARTCLIENVLDDGEISERAYDQLPEYYSSEACFESDVDTPDGWVAEADGSVNGPEFKFDGPASYSTSLELFSTMKWGLCQIDTKCSFHIHVSECGPTLPSRIWNKEDGYMDRRALRHFAMEYIMAQKANFPAALVRRMCSATRHSFASIAQEKTWTRYTCVNFCERYETLEFRLFGGISTESDGIYCLDLARDAFNHAVERYTAGERAPADFVGQWQAWENYFL